MSSRTITKGNYSVRVEVSDDVVGDFEMSSQNVEERIGEGGQEPSRTVRIHPEADPERVETTQGLEVRKAFEDLRE